MGQCEHAPLRTASAKPRSAQPPAHSAVKGRPPRNSSSVARAASTVESGASASAPPAAAPSPPDCVGWRRRLSELLYMVARVETRWLRVLARWLMVHRGLAAQESRTNMPGLFCCLSSGGAICCEEIVCSARVVRKYSTYAEHRHAHGHAHGAGRPGRALHAAIFVLRACRA